jgi:hypothetical protein
MSSRIMLLLKYVGVKFHLLKQTSEVLHKHFILNCINFVLSGKGILEMRYSKCESCVIILISH